MSPRVLDVAPPRDQGSAVVEFSILGVLLLLPVVYLVTLLGRIEAAAFAVDAAAREGAVSAVRADDEAAARSRGLAAVTLALADHRVDFPAAEAFELTCSAACLEPGSRVQVRVAVDVRLPGVPAWFDAVVPSSVPVSAQQTQMVDRFRAAPGAAP